MRCRIVYKRGPFTGYEDFGVSGEDDPKVLTRIEQMRAEGTEVLRVSFW